MTDPRYSNEQDLDELLAQGRLSGPTKDRIFHAVSAQLGREGRPARRWTLGLSLTAGVLAAAGVALVAVPRQQENRDETSSPFRAKGSGGSASVDIDAVCRGGTLQACPVGATLMFAVRGTDQGFLTAYADPLLGGERIWYSGPEAAANALVGVGDAAATPRAVRIGAEHAPGEYRVRVFVTRTHLPRAELLAGAPAHEIVAQRDLTLTVLPPAAARP